jgi:hypothetical protein
MICYGQGDDVMKLQRVTARDSGKLLIGLACREWIPTQKTDIWQLGGPASATIETPIDPDSSSAALTVRDSEMGPYQIIRRDQWRFSADLQQIVVPGGFPLPTRKIRDQALGEFCFAVAGHARAVTGHAGSAGRGPRTAAIPLSEDRG